MTNLTNQHLVKAQTPHETQQVSFPSGQEWQQIIDIASRAYKSGLLPSGIKSPEAASIIALKAWELGLPPMMAFSHIHIISGTPTLSAELMQALVRKNLPGIQITILESTDTNARIEIRRPERGAIAYISSFSIEDAKKANLTNKDTWKHYPKSMIFSRCMSNALRKICPDALAGVSYTPEELGADLGATGEIVETSFKPVESPSPVPPPSQPTSPAQEQGSPASLSPDEVEHPWLLKQLNQVMRQLDVEIGEVRNYTILTFSKERSTDLTKEELEKTIAWVKLIGRPSEPTPAPIMHAWEKEALNDPRMVK
jgi:hypothetical protein